MFISNNLLWVVPHLRKIERLHDLSKVTDIIGVSSFPLSRIQPHIGVTRTSNGRKFTIEVCLTYQTKFKPFGKNKCHIKKAPLSKVDILEILAHELAHVFSDFMHTPEHKILECKIKAIFMKQLIREDYISEEVELLKLKQLS